MFEQAFYSLSELSQRWGKLYQENVSSKQILHLGLQSTLNIQVSKQILSRLQGETYRSLDDDISIFVGAYAYELYKDDGAPNYVLERRLGQRSVSVFEPLDEETVLEIILSFQATDMDYILIDKLILKQPPDEVDTLRMGLIRKSDNANYKEFIDFLTLDLDCLFVSQKDVRAYENSLKEPEEGKPAELIESKEQTYQAIIGALLDLMKTSGRANWNQNSINRTIQECYKLKGLGDRKLAGYFSDANTAFEDIFEKSEDAFNELRKENEP